MESWHGEGWYKIGYSDEPSGAQWSADGARWYETREELAADIDAAKERETETHLVWCSYLGDGEEPESEEQRGA